MPIRPENRHYYRGQQWRDLRALILARAGHCCEGSPAYPECRAANHAPHPVTGSRVVLTIAHMVLRPGRALATVERVRRARVRFGERFVMPYYSSGSGLTGRSIDRPLGTVTTRDRWAVVDGDRMRMMQPEELARAMSFPAGYHLPQKPRSLPIHLLGNAVCPLQAEAVIRAVVEAA